MLELYTSEDLIMINPTAKNKKELFKEMTDLLAEKGIIRDRTEFFNSLIARENLSNTAIIPQVAIPHTGCKGVEKLFLLIAVSEDGIDYENDELGPVNIVFLFGCCNQQNNPYLKLLAKSARLLSGSKFREMLIKCRSAQELMETLVLFDQDMVDHDQRMEYLLIINLFDQDKLPALLGAMMELGINNGSVIQSSSMAKIISYDIPIFAGLQLQSKKKKTQTSTVLTTITDNRLPRKLAVIMKENNFDFEKPGNGFMQLFKLSTIIGEYDEFSV